MNTIQFFRKEKVLTLFFIIFLASFLLVTFFRLNLQSLNVEINNWIPTIQSNSLTAVAFGIAVVFDTPSLTIATMLISSLLFIKKYRAESLLLLVAMGADALIVFAVKNLVQSLRPINGLEFASGYSYPSGHTAGSIVFCGCLAFFAWQHWRSIRSRRVGWNWGCCNNVFSWFQSIIFECSLV